MQDQGQKPGPLEECVLVDDSADVPNVFRALKRPWMVVSQLLGALVLLSVLAGSIKLILGKANLFEDYRSYVFISKRPRAADMNLEQLVALNPRLGYFRSDSSFAKGVLKLLPRGQADQPLVMVRASDYMWSTSDPAEIQSTLELADRPLQDHSFVPFVFASALGCLIGLFFSAHVSRFIPWGFGILTVAATYKYSFACPTCPVVQIFGVDAALVGMLSFGALLSLSLIRPTTAWLAVPGISSAVVLWQFMNVIGSSNLCIPCVAIVFLNCLFVPLAFNHMPSSLRIGTWPAKAAATFCALVLAASGLLISHRVVAASRPPQLIALGTRPRPLFVGKSLRELGVKVEDIPGTAGLVLFGLSTCEPCNQARLALLNQSAFPVKVIELVRPEDRKGGWPGSSVPYSDSLFPTTPLLVVTDAQGRIVDQFFGWTSDPTWQMALTQSVRQDLARGALPKR